MRNPERGPSPSQTPWRCLLSTHCTTTRAPPARDYPANHPSPVYSGSFCRLPSRRRRHSSRQRGEVTFSSSLFKARIFSNRALEGAVCIAYWSIPPRHLCTGREELGADAPHRHLPRRLGLVLSLALFSPTETAVAFQLRRNFFIIH
jgi:hypothetical protein